MLIVKKMKIVKKIDICPTFDKTNHNVIQICQNDMVENTFEEHKKNVKKLHQWFFLSQMIKVWIRGVKIMMKGNSIINILWNINIYFEILLNTFVIVVKDNHLTIKFLCILIIY